ncbi:hypothetical protein LTR10_012217 [Elasticomyces elasticus]|nr:hypothetical protein LTR10_012217 [Elasticomyces elasticus]KAK4965697.1 hypothetical protein LTR42_011710 [Elasticomyces elasticus]
MGSRTQNAVFVYEVGKPVRLGQRAVPSPKAGEVLVKVTAAQLLPHDSYGRDRGVFIGEKLPFVLGSSLAGTIEELGPDVAPDYELGERVFGTSNLQCPTPDQAGLQQYAILQADSIGRTPSNFSDDEVATLPINVATIMIALFSKFGFEFSAPWEEKPFDFASQTILVLGAGTNAAKIFTRFATKQLGIKNIITVASLANTAALLEIGATTVIDRHAPEDSIIEQVHIAAGGIDNVAMIIECASWEHHLAASLLTPNKPSRLVTLHRVNEAKVQEHRPLCRATLVQNSNANLGSHAKPFWDALPQWLQSGLVLPTAFRTLDGLENVDEINRQLDEYAAGKGDPQLVIRP